MIGHLINHVKQDLTHNVKSDKLKIYHRILLIKNIEKIEDNRHNFLKEFMLENKIGIEYQGNGIFYSASGSKYRYNNGLRFGRYFMESGQTIDIYNYCSGLVRSK